MRLPGGEHRVALLIVIFRKVLGIDLIFCFHSLAVKQVMQKKPHKHRRFTYALVWDGAQKN